GSFQSPTGRDNWARSWKHQTCRGASESRPTPSRQRPQYRNRGFASATVGVSSRLRLVAGLRCVLYTELANPVFNSVYQRLSYRAVTEIPAIRLRVVVVPPPAVGDSVGVPRSVQPFRFAIRAPAKMCG